jgi:hypothetical protein
MTAGIKPSLASLSENIASSAATTISQTAINPSPPPKAGPCTLAMTGQGAFVDGAIHAGKAGGRHLLPGHPRPETWIASIGDRPRRKKPVRRWIAGFLSGTAPEPIRRMPESVHLSSGCRRRCAVQAYRA